VTYTDLVEISNKLYQTIQHFIEMWREIIPQIPEPEIEDASWWLDYDATIVEHAMIIAARRFSHRTNEQSFDAKKAYRFVTSTCKALENEQRSSHAA